MPAHKNRSSLGMRCSSDLTRPALRRRKVRGLLAALTFGLAVPLFPVVVAAALPAFEIQVLDTAASAVTANTVASGVLDTEFKPYQYSETHRRSAPFWLRIQPA